MCCNFLATTHLRAVSSHAAIAAGQSLAKILGRNQCTVSLACNEMGDLFVLFVLFLPFVLKRNWASLGYDTYKSEFVEDGIDGYTLRCSPSQDAIVTTRMTLHFQQGSYKPSFPTVTGRRFATQWIHIVEDTTAPETGFFVVHTLPHVMLVLEHGILGKSVHLHACMHINTILDK